MKKKRLLELIIGSVISCILYAFAIKCFIEGSGMVSNGIGGISIIISKLIKGNESLFSIFMIGLNIPIILLSFKRIGKFYTIFTLFQILLSSLLVAVIPHSLFNFLKLDLVTDMLLISVIAGALVGASSGISLKCGCSTGGVDTLITYIGVKYNKQVGYYSFILNTVILLVAGLCFHDWKAVLYTIISIAVSSVVLDLIYRRAKKRLIKIATKHPDEVRDNILRISKHGMTIGDVIGGFDGTSRKIIETIVLEDEVKDIIKAAKIADNEAFISVLNVYETVGKYTMPDIE